MIIADEHLAELMPIFERIRAQGGLPISYPLHVTSGGTAFIGGTRSTPLSPHAPHCHPSTHWVSFDSFLSSERRKVMITSEISILLIILFK